MKYISSGYHLFLRYWLRLSSDNVPRCAFLLCRWIHWTTLFQVLVSLQTLRNLALDFRLRFIMAIRVVLECPRDNSIAVSQLRIEQIQPHPGLLGHSGDLLQQIAEVLDMPGLLAQETRLDRIDQRRLAALLGHLAQPLQILQDPLLDGEGLPARLDGLDRRVWPLALGRLDRSRPAAASARHQVLLHPVEVDQTLLGASFKQPFCLSAWLLSQTRHERTFRIHGGRY